MSHKFLLVFTPCLLSSPLLPSPDLQSRVDILKIHSRKMNLMRGIDLSKVAEKMHGASGAELKVRLGGEQSSLSTSILTVDALLLV